MKAKKRELQARMALDPNAKPVTPDILCRTLTGKSEATLVRQLQLFGNAYLDEEIRRMKSQAAVK